MMFVARSAAAGNYVWIVVNFTKHFFVVLFAWRKSFLGIFHNYSVFDKLIAG